MPGSRERGEYDRYREVIRTGIPFTGIEEIPDPQYGRRWLDIKSFRAGDGLGIVTADVTWQKVAEDELREANEQLTASEEELRSNYEELAFAQAKLLESQQQLTGIAGTVPGVVYQFFARPDGTMGLYYVSDRAEEVLGISRNTGDFFQRFTQHIDSRDREAFLNSVNDAVSSKSPWDFTGRFQKPSGETIWFRGISRPFERSGEIVFSGFFLDITERKRAEEDLFNSRQMLQAVLDSIPQRVFWKDRNSVFLGCNMPLALDAGFSDPAGMVGKTDYDHASHATADLYRADDRQVMESGLPRINYEEPQIKPDGSHAWLRTTKVPLRDKEGTIIGVLGTYEDITAQKRAQEKLRESEERYRNIIVNSPYGMHFYELQPGRGLIFTGANPGADRILGVSHEPFIGKTIEEAFPGLRGTDVPGRYREVAESGTVWQTEQVTYDEGSIGGAYAVTAFRTAPGSMAAMFVDITDRKRMEQALAQKTEELEQYFNASLDLFCIAGTDGTFRRLNPEWEKTLGYTRAELEGHRFLDFVHPDDLPSTLAAVADLTDQKKVLNFTNR
jgi:PAS domain S-box-containing protein